MKIKIFIVFTHTTIVSVVQLCSGLAVWVFHVGRVPTPAKDTFVWTEGTVRGIKRGSTEL